MASQPLKAGASTGTMPAIVPGNGNNLPAQQGPTILGVELRRRMIALVNGLAHGMKIRVHFRGTRAYTDGLEIVLPAIRDLAEIPYSTARALIGYAIHEVAHIRYTDFVQVLRAFEAGKLVKKFENAIEDYRIEREMTREFRGAASDLTALRIAVHPAVNKLPPEWYADPRVCGPLALTWTGSRFNGFANPGVQPSLDAMPKPVYDLVMDWTRRMEHVKTTEEVVDLALQFAAEAEAYADLTRATPPPANDTDDETDDDQKTDDQPQDADDSQDDDAQSDDQDNASDDDQSDDSDDGDDGCTGDSGDTDMPGDDQNTPAVSDMDPADNTASDQGQVDDADKDDLQSADGAGGADADDSDETGTDNTGGDSATSDTDQGQDSDSAEKSNSPATSSNDNPSADADGDPEIEPGGSGDSDDTSDPTDANSAKPSDSKSSDRSSNSNSGGSSSAAGSSEPSDNGGETPTDQTPSDGDPTQGDTGQQPTSDADAANQPEAGDTPSSSAAPDGNAPNDDDPFGANGEYAGEDDEPLDMPSGDQAPNQKSPGNAGDCDASDAADPDGNQTDTANPADGSPDGESESDASDDPFSGVFEDGAQLTDLLDDLREMIAEQDALPEDAPEATDGEVDPAEVLKSVDDANSVAPDYISDDPDPDADPADASKPSASKHHYNDSRFAPVETVSEDDQFETLRSQAQGAIATTARTIKRLLMAQENSGINRNRRSGQFDIRNMSAIIRQTGTCYRQPWEKPAPKTLLATLIDFSGSMKSTYDYRTQKHLPVPPITLAMMGALAVEQAVQNTSVNTAIYGYTGSSPDVYLSVFKEGPQSSTITRRRLGSYLGVGMDCTPTGEAMAAIAQRMDHAEEERRVMLVLTDGDADDPDLCASVSQLLIRRGIEVVAIGINSESVNNWAPVAHVINHINELPAALLATIDPRNAKKSARARMAA